METPRAPIKRIKSDNEIAQDVVDGGRLIQAGVRSGDEATQGAGVARVVKEIGTNIPPALAKFLGLDKVQIKDD